MAIVDQGGQRCRCPTPWRSRTARRRSATSTRTSSALEAEQLWSRTWQMACRLEEIPEPGDFVEYEILDQSVIVVRTEDGGVRRLPERLPAPRRQGGSRAGDLRERVHLPVPRVVLRARRHQHPRPADADLRRAQPPAGRHRPDARAVRDVGRVRLDQPRRRRAAAARVHRAGRHDPRRLEGRVAAGRVVVRRPPPRELEARRRGVPWSSTTWSRRTRSCVIPGMRYARPRAARRTPGPSSSAELQYLRTMSEGMAGMVHADDVRIAEGLRDIDLPADPDAGHGGVAPRAQRRRHRLAPGARATTSPTSTSSRRGAERADGLLLPALVRAADVQQRLVLPLPPARAGGDADGDLVAHPVPGRRGAAAARRRPRCGSATTPAGRRSPRRTSRTCPASRRGLHARGFEYMRLSERAEGHIVNFERTVDGFLAGLPHERAGCRRCRRST